MKVKKAIKDKLSAMLKKKPEAPDTEQEAHAVASCVPEEVPVSANRRRRGVGYSGKH